MNDDTEQVACPVCTRLITVVLVWEPADYSVGLHAGWTGGIAIEDTACFEHLTYDQREAVLDAAIAQHGSEPPDNRASIEAEIARDLDEMQRQCAFERTQERAGTVDWCGSEPPY